MAGTIILGKNWGVAMSSIAFDHITEKIRSYFDDAEASFRDEIFRPVDEGGMSFVSLREQGGLGFNAFLRAAKAAFAAELVEYPLSPFISSWNELIDSLRTDPRSAEDGAKVQGPINSNI